jgi:hypothetical protein
VWPNAFVGQSFADEVSFLKQWIRQRIEWMDQELLLPPLFSIHGGTVNRGAKLQLHAHQGAVYYTLDGSDPRAPGGGVSRSAKVYKSSIVLGDSTTVCCRAMEGSRWSYPSVSKFVIGRP